MNKILKHYLPVIMIMIIFVFQFVGCIGDGKIARENEKKAKSLVKEYVKEKYGTKIHINDVKCIWTYGMEWMSPTSRVNVKVTDKNKETFNVMIDTAEKDKKKIGADDKQRKIIEKDLKKYLLSNFKDTRIENFKAGSECFIIDDYSGYYSEKYNGDIEKYLKSDNVDMECNIYGLNLKYDKNTITSKLEEVLNNFDDSSKITFVDCLNKEKMQKVIENDKKQKSNSDDIGLYTPDNINGVYYAYSGVDENRVQSTVFDKKFSFENGINVYCDSSIFDGDMKLNIIGKDTMENGEKLKPLSDLYEISYNGIINKDNEDEKIMIEVPKDVICLYENQVFCEMGKDDEGMHTTSVKALEGLVTESRKGYFFEIKPNNSICKIDYKL